MNCMYVNITAISNENKNPEITKTLSRERSVASCIKICNSSKLKNFFLCSRRVLFATADCDVFPIFLL